MDVARGERLAVPGLEHEVVILPGLPTLSRSTAYLVWC